jgi:L-lactate dehydrogenase complex protein LldE
MSERPVSVGLFVTCLVDLFRPTIGFAAVRLLEEAGCKVAVPRLQTCCGQPAYNSGDRKNAVAIARGVIQAFRGFDYVVAPSGSCAGMIKVHYPALFAADPKMKAAAEDLAGRTYELIAFLTEAMGMTRVVADFTGAVTYHDSCSGLRELGIKEQPRKLLASMPGLTLKELPGAETCCGFGGTFAVKYGEVSAEIARRKAKDIMATGADTLLAGDLGCLLNMAGSLSREGATLKVRHVAEVLAGMARGPAIGQPSEGAEPGRR